MSNFVNIIIHGKYFIVGETYSSNTTFSKTLLLRSTNDRLNCIHYFVFPYFNKLKK